MRIQCFAVLLAVATAGCVTQEERLSIERMNEGVEAFSGGHATIAVRALGEATTYDPANHQAWYILGQVHGSGGDWEEAAEAFAEAVKYMDSDAMYHFRLGEALVESGQLDLAETHLERAVELNERLFRAWYYLGTTYDETDRPREAAEAWTKAAEFNPLFGPPFIDLGRLYIRWDMFDQAIQVLEQGAQHVRRESELTDIHYFLGLAHHKNRNSSQAIEAFTKALEVRSSNLEAMLQRGFVYAETGEVEKAMADLREFVQRGGGGNAFNIQAANDRLMRLRALD
jgi:tetratricopeptide (TPR) repeat protein